MKPAIVALILAALTSSAFADSDQCNDLFQARANLATAQLALNCWNTLMQSTRGSDAATYAQAAELGSETAFWIFSQSRGRNREDAASMGAEIAADALRIIPASGIGSYWAGVFQILKCRVVDGTVPTCFNQSRDAIFAYLRSARDVDSSTHGMGPSRVLGILYRDLPRLSGGDLRMARRYLDDALSGAPNFSSNILESARLSLKERDPTAARRLLEDFLSNTCRTMDPTRIPECEDDRSQASSILRRLKALAQE